MADSFVPSRRTLELFRTAAVSKAPVITSSSAMLSPHGIYKYPARFHPSVAALAIQAFSEPGDTVFDPFIGSGATMIEAMRHQRNCVGVDVSELATFIARTATHLYTEREVREVQMWAARTLSAAHRASGDVSDVEMVQLNIPAGPARRIVRSAAGLIQDAENLSPWSERLVRAAVLRASQWALDLRREVPNVHIFREYAGRTAMDAAYSLRHFRASVREEWGPNLPLRSHKIHRGRAKDIAAKLEGKCLFNVMVTSPPYPSVHILYHRWQIMGRHESALPFWIAGVSDAITSSEYTMFARRDEHAARYFEELEITMSAARQLMEMGSFAVHVVGFRDPISQLPRYVAAMKRSGFVEKKYRVLATGSDGRLWRDVPSRRWYAEQQTHQGSSREVVLVFRSN